MNKLTLGAASFAAAMALLLGCSSNDGKSLVSGTLSGAEGSKVYLNVVGLAQQQTCDSATVGSDGKFELRGLVQTEPTFYDVRLADGRSFTVLLDSAQCLSLEADASGKMLVGNVKFNDSKRNDDLQTVMVGASSLLSEINKKDANKDELSAKIDNFKLKLRDMIFADPTSMVGYYIVMQNVAGYKLFDVMDKKDHMVFSAAATSLQLKYPASEQVKYLCEYVLGARAQQRSNALRDSIMNTADRLNSPELILPNKDGEQVSLSSFRGKTVLLYFWMAADETARRAHADLISTYNKYKDRGLAIYSVSFDTSKLIWEDAISANGIDWVNVCDLKGSQSSAAMLYNVRNVPSNYILDAEGNLIGKDLFGTRLDNKLSEILR